ncbi:SpaA isopeptide-forming pilin-related protein [Streptococcus marmotae]|uniref:SpaA isopeptide-forming pilin-related protein n=1 Tax=Streptococcus marmotae TaxID=1825069 RepID=UPI000835BF0E|nr:SpaA isopeptide-forming pilin-related protein [Streptococcus marmotae]
MKIRKLFALLMTSLTLGLVSFIRPVHADDQQVGVTIISPVGQQDVRYQLFQIADKGQIEKVKTLSKDVLEKTYPFVETRASGELGKQIVTVGLGTYYVVAVSSSTNQLVSTIAPFLLGVTDVGKDHVIYAKPYHPTGDVQLFKYEWKDGGKSPLAGVVFTLYDANHQPVRVKHGQATLDADGVHELETDRNGRLSISGLAEGDYYFKEVRALPGYQLLQQDYAVTIKQGNVAHIEVENKPTDKGGKRFRKVNEEKAVLKGAVFTVLDSKKNTLFQVTSDENGYFEVTNLPYGDYFLREEKAPVVDGVEYALLSQEIRFSVTATSYMDGTILEIINKPLASTPPSPPTDPKLTPPSSNLPPIIRQFLPHTGEAVSIMGMIGLLAIGLVLIVKKKRKTDDQN